MTEKKVPFLDHCLPESDAVGINNGAHRCFNRLVGLIAKGNAVKLSKALSKEWHKLSSDSRWGDLDEQAAEQLQRCMLSSPWLTQWIKSQADWQEPLRLATQDVQADAELEQFADQWQVNDEACVMRDLRVWRNRHMARLMMRDILGLNHVRDTARAVSDLADSAIRFALRWSAAYWQAKDGEPGLCRYTQQPSELVVIAMGKHGACELNLSSDIDLIFAFPNSGETDKGRSHEEFFTRVGRKLIQLLDVRTSDGFVFRVDMRLRPWGQSGALVSNFNALQNYYLQQGRFWERFAMVKARFVTGSKPAQQALTDILLPFVYRRYVDFQAVGALRELKSKIQTEVRRQNLSRNIKLGQGGIREVEFIAQVFQLIRGCTDTVLQQRGTWPILKEIGELGLLPEQVVAELVQAYDFLRDLEHRIQALRDEQTQNLPVDEIDLDRLVLSARFDSAESLLARLAVERDKVQEHFSHIISDVVEPGNVDKRMPFQQSWQQGVVVSPVADDELTAEIFAFRAMPGVARLTGVAKENLDDFMSLFWLELSRHSDAVIRFQAIKPILESILRRTSYFTLLSENAGAIREMVKLVPVSPWIATYLTEKPFLLDELTDSSSLYLLPKKTELMDELHQLLLRVPEDDLERQMEVLRHFRHGRALRAAACEVTDQLPLMKISDYLAWVAEVVVDQALALVWRQMVSRHGRPSKAEGEWCDPDFGVVAYGKMGGLELSYESDLDLVFLHNASPQGMTEGPKPIENVVFMARLGQKLIHMLSAVTPSGMLYEVDTRLRPSGNSGLLVSSLAAFKKYQQEQAWTWEHQALVRSRYIAGDLELKQQFEDFRREVICAKRDASKLKTEVIEMRQKMLDNLSSQATGKDAEEVFNLKQDSGGIVDLEFLVQFCLLNFAHEHAELAEWSDNVRSIEALAKARVISPQERESWLNAYLYLRQHVHHAILGGGSKTLAKADVDSKLEAVRQQIKGSWQQWMGQ